MSAAHPDGCTCHGCTPRPPISKRYANYIESGHTEIWRKGVNWDKETLPWLTGKSNGEGELTK